METQTNSILTVDRRTAFDKHEEARQSFIAATMAIREHLGIGSAIKSDPFYELLRANAAVAQGMVWAEVCGIDPAGWFSRMSEVQALWTTIAAQVWP